MNFELSPWLDIGVRIGSARVFGYQLQHVGIIGSARVFGYQLQHVGISNAKVLVGGITRDLIS